MTHRGNVLMRLPFTRPELKRRVPSIDKGQSVSRWSSINVRCARLSYTDEYQEMVQPGRWQGSRGVATAVSRILLSLTTSQQVQFTQ